MSRRVWSSCPKPQTDFSKLCMVFAHTTIFKTWIYCMSSRQSCIMSALKRNSQHRWYAVSACSRFGTRWSWRSLPTLTILWFYDSMILCLMHLTGWPGMQYVHLAKFAKSTAFPMSSFPWSWEQAMAFVSISCHSFIRKPNDKERMGPDWWFEY